MNQIIDFFTGLFDTSLWPPRWHCGKWTEFHGWLYIISDLLIFSAYFAMPVIIVRYIATRTNSRFHSIYFLFAAFILACGFTHLLDAISFWYPVYRFNALARFITGLISWATVYQLIKILPVAFSLKTAGELEVEVEQRKKAEEALNVKVKELNEAQEIAKMGHWEWNAQTNTFIISDNLFRIYELKPQITSISYEQFLQCVHPEDKTNVDQAMQQALADKKFNDFFYRIPFGEGKSKTIQMKGEILMDDDLNVHKILGTSQDVTQQKSIEKELNLKSTLLESKNEELQKFAYVASHDLQEPLRKIRTLISRLQDAEEHNSPEKEKEFIAKIDFSATRMQHLIDDILSFSRISFNDIAQFERTDLNAVLKVVLSDMEIAIDKNKANIKAGNLPVIFANPTQIGQLFQNIISNAIKFKNSTTPPVIEITASVVTSKEIVISDWIRSHYAFSEWKENRFWDQEKFCVIKIADNGIGFDQEYATRIFEAFQRLTLKYEGSGIGLAICKKIVENHHGAITAASVPGKGTAFTIILPVSQSHFTESVN